jgi:hypothetical protein
MSLRAVKVRVCWEIGLEIYLPAIVANGTEKAARNNSSEREPCFGVLSI